VDGRVVFSKQKEGAFIPTPDMVERIVVRMQEAGEA
jgi:hypothetical protein